MFSQTNVDEVNLQMRPHLESLMNPKPFRLLTLRLFSQSKVFLWATTGHDTLGYKTDWLTEAHPSQNEFQVSVSPLCRLFWHTEIELRNFWIQKLQNFGIQFLKPLTSNFNISAAARRLWHFSDQREYFVRWKSILRFDRYKVRS